MRRMILIISVILVIGLAVFAACSFGGEEPTPEPVAVDTVPQPRVVSAEAFVVPIQEADLSLEIGGRVVDVAIEEGQSVQQGDLLVKVDDTSQQAQLAEAQAGLAQIEALHAEAEARGGEAEVGVMEAEANLAKVKANPTIEQIAQLQANLARSEAVLAELLAGPTAEEIAEAGARVQTSQAQLNELLAPAREEDLQAAGSRLLQTQADVREAQSAYDKVRYGDPDDVLATGVLLEKATLAYEGAQAEYDRLVNGATPEQIATSRSMVVEAQASLTRVKAGATPEQIAQAQADVARAEADLANLLAGATDEEIAIAEAQVAAANSRVTTSQASVDAAAANVASAVASVASAQTQVNKTELTAPFAGTVSIVNINEGEVIQAGVPVMSVGDTSTWQIETDDLTEIDVVEVNPGATVHISVDALPGEPFEGKVARITPKSVTKAGDVTYTVLINIVSGDTSKLKWGMTTFVDIEVDAGPAR